MARTTHNPAIAAILTVADIRESVRFSWDENDIAIGEFDDDFVCEADFI
jgi:hypothetical protein